MSTETFETEYLPAEHSDLETLEEQNKIFKQYEILQVLMGVLPTNILVLNDKREIVCANKTFMSLLNINDVNDILGKRPGDVLMCDHAINGGNGCGTTKFCKVCGAATAIVGAMNNQFTVEECSVAKADGDAYDLEVWASPFIHGKEHFTIFAVLDKSDEKRKLLLERIFYHDILNTAGGIRGAVELMADSDPVEMKELAHLSRGLSEQLIEEIQSQREINEAERNNLSVNPKPFSTFDMLKELQALYLSHDITEDRKIIIGEDCVDEIMISDKALIRRVLGNMIKNALEASPDGATVKINCLSKDDQFVYLVHNTTYMPEVYQLQVFKRSFSTKGSGRGVGTYSMKLFSERFLGGAISFNSNKENGTTFYASFPKELRE